MVIRGSLDQEGKLSFACPSCGKTLKMEAGPGGWVRCPRSNCQVRFEVRPAGPAPVAQRPSAVDSPQREPRFIGESPRQSPALSNSPTGSTVGIRVDALASPQHSSAFPWKRVVVSIVVAALIIPSSLGLGYDWLRSQSLNAETLIAGRNLDNFEGGEDDRGLAALAPPSPPPANDSSDATTPSQENSPASTSATAPSSSNIAPTPSNESSSSRIGRATGESGRGPRSPGNQDLGVQGPAISGSSLPNISDSQLLAELRREVVVSGTLESEMVTQYHGLDSTTIHSWQASLTLTNNSEFDLNLGEDLLLVEIPSVADAAYEGFGVFDGTSIVSGPESYGLINNYESLGQRNNFGNGFSTLTFLGTDSMLGGSLASGGNWRLERDFPEYTWIIEPTGVDLVFPELQVAVQTETKRFRLIARFQSAGAGKSWTLQSQRWIPIQERVLSELLADESEHDLIRVLAANQLAEYFPDTSETPLVSACRGRREGQLLASGLILMTGLEKPGLESQAIELLQDSMLPNGIRAFSASYLGAIKHRPARAALVEAAKGDDSVVALACVRALGRIGDVESVNAIFELMADTTLYLDRSTLFEALAVSGNAEANRRLQQLATNGDSEAFRALAYSGHESNWEFFERLASDNPDSTQKGLIGNGLWQTGRERALPLLLELIDDRAFHDEANYDGTELVSVLSMFDSPEAIESLLTFAEGGNRRAASALAGMSTEAVQEPLTELASSSNEGVRQIALDALSRRWPEESFELFAAGLTSSNQSVIQASIRGIQACEDPRAFEQLLPLLSHRDESVKQSAIWAMEGLPLGDQVEELADVFLQSTDPAVIVMAAGKLLDAGWKDTNQIAEVGGKLSRVEVYQAYGLVKLLRHLTDNAIGPETDDEWYNESEEWIKRWKTWIRNQ